MCWLLAARAPVEVLRALPFTMLLTKITQSCDIRECTTCMLELVPKCPHAIHIVLNPSLFFEIADNWLMRPLVCYQGNHHKRKCSEVDAEDYARAACRDCGIFVLGASQLPMHQHGQQHMAQLQLLASLRMSDTEEEGGRGEASIEEGEEGGLCMTRSCDNIDCIALLSTALTAKISCVLE